MSDDNASLGLALLGFATRGTFTAGLDGITYPTAPASPPPPPPPPEPPPAWQREAVDRAVAKALAANPALSEDDQLDQSAGLAPETAAEALARARAIGERAARTLREAQALKQTAKAEKAARKAAKKGKK